MLLPESFDLPSSSSSISSSSALLAKLNLSDLLSALPTDAELEGILQEEEDADQALLKALGGALVFCCAMAGPCPTCGQTHSKLLQASSPMCSCCCCRCSPSVATTASSSPTWHWWTRCAPCCTPSWAFSGLLAGLCRGNCRWPCSPSPPFASTALLVRSFLADDDSEVEH